MPAARRSGITTPCAPKPAALRIDRAEVARVGDRVERHDQRLLAVRRGGARAGRRGGRTRTTGSARRGPGARRRRSSGPARRGSPRAGCTPRSAASLNASRSRPSRSAPSATYTPVTGTPSRSASTTELRPATHSASVEPVARRFGRAAAADLSTLLRGLVGLVVRAVLGLRRRARALEPAADAAAGAGGRVALAGLLDRALALASCLPSAIACSSDHFGPVGVSSISMPAALIRSRIASAVAKSLPARASARCSSRPCDEGVDGLR